jgi:hypothetical protein
MRRQLSAPGEIPAALVGGTPRAHAGNNGTFHYACQNKNDGSRYALTVNTKLNVVTLMEHGSPHTVTTFRIVRAANPLNDECGKGGWVLNGGVTFCYATQGAGGFEWHGREFDCDQADTE